jgi:hypothetical protein
LNGKLIVEIFKILCSESPEHYYRVNRNHNYKDLGYDKQNQLAWVCEYCNPDCTDRFNKLTSFKCEGERCFQNCPDWVLEVLNTSEADILNALSEINRLRDDLHHAREILNNIEKNLKELELTDDIYINFDNLMEKR